MRIPRLTVLGSIPPTTDKNPVRRYLSARYIRRDARRWMQEFKNQSAAIKVKTDPMTLLQAPDEVMRRVPTQSEIDLLVCFVNRFEPALATNIGRLLYDARLRSMLVLSHGRLEWGSDWLHNLQTVPESASMSRGVLVSGARLMPENKLQIREMDCYKICDMQLLIDRMISDQTP